MNCFLHSAAFGVFSSAKLLIHQCVTNLGATYLMDVYSLMQRCLLKKLSWARCGDISWTHSGVKQGSCLWKRAPVCVHCALVQLHVLPVELNGH